MYRERLYSVLSLLYAIFVMVLGVSLPIAELSGNNTNKVFIGSFEVFILMEDYKFIVIVP